MTWDEFLANQSQNGTHATELFLKTIAVFIGMNIHIITQYCTTEYIHTMQLHHHGMIQMKIVVMQS